MKKIVTPENILAIASRQLVTNVVPALVRNFNFFKEVKKIQPATIGKIGNHFGFDLRVLEATLYYLVKENFLNMTTKDKEEFFSLSELSEIFLVNESDGTYDFSALTLMFGKDINIKAETAIVFALTTGKSANWSDEFGTWENTMRCDPNAKKFSASMMCRAVFLRDHLVKAIGPILEKYTNLIDIGGSMGDYCGYFSEKFKNLVSTVFDFPEVIKSAEQNIDQKGYPRVKTLGGDMFEGIPSGHDVHFFSNVLHDWRSDQVNYLLGKSYQSLTNGGAVIIHDLFINNDKKSPSHGIDHSLNLAVFTQGKYYTCAETIEALKKTGFKKIKTINTCVGYKAIVGYKT